MIRSLRVKVGPANDGAGEDSSVSLSAQSVSIDEHGTLFVQWDGGSQFFGDSTWGKVIIERADHIEQQ